MVCHIVQGFYETNIAKARRHVGGKNPQQLLINCIYGLSRLKVDRSFMVLTVEVKRGVVLSKEMLPIHHTLFNGLHNLHILYLVQRACDEGC